MMNGTRQPHVLNAAADIEFCTMMLTASDMKKPRVAVI